MKFPCAFVTLLSVLALSSALNIGCNADSKSVKIGVVLPLSGSMAEYGQNGKEGLTLAAEQLNQSAGKKVSLLYQDSKDAPQDTVSAVHRLVDVDNVQFIIGGLTSSGVLAAAPYAQQKGVLFFSPAASAPGIPEIGDLVFRNWPSDDAMAMKYGEAAYHKGIRKVAVLSVSNDYGNVNSTAFESAFSSKGGVVLLKKAFPQGTTDFKTLVAQLSALKELDRVLVIAYPDEYRSFFQELTRSRLKPNMILVSDTFYSPTLVGELGSLAEGVLCGVAAKPSDDYLPRRQFIDAYQSRLKNADGKAKSPGLVSDTAYDALKLLGLGIRNTDGSPRAVADYLLHKISAYQGAAGVTTFTANREINGDLSLYEVKAGGFVPVSL
jgi:branched-chain amino acid transport system substrate-binding protein